jgi:hypothetical protein
VYWLAKDKLAAIPIANGTVEWCLDTTAVQAGLCVGENTVAAPVSYDEFDLATTWPTIAAFDRESGETRWHYHIGGFDVAFRTSPVLVDGAVYFVSRGHAAPDERSPVVTRVLPPNFGDLARDNLI